jgi:hypothetical protein
VTFPEGWWQAADDDDQSIVSSSIDAVAGCFGQFPEIAAIAMGPCSQEHDDHNVHFFGVGYNIPIGTVLANVARSPWLVLGCRLENAEHETDEATRLVVSWWMCVVWNKGNDHIATFEMVQDIASGQRVPLSCSVEGEYKMPFAPFLLAAMAALSPDEAFSLLHYWDLGIRRGVELVPPIV